MEYMPERDQMTAIILCCQCGAQIEPNPANMCVACLRTEVDITEGIPKHATLYFCKNCERYLQPPSSWVSAVLESRELLGVCLKKLKGLSKVRLVDAGFVWTEPHSKRLKVKLAIQKEVMNGALLQQNFVVEFVVHGQMCEDCHRVEAKDFWRAVVQIRQKTSHKKTLYMLEQLILKHGAHANTTTIKPVHDGLDFFYANKQDGKKLLDFVMTVVPCKYQTAQELISQDIQNNSFNYKTTFSVEIIPICKDSVVCLPPQLAQQMGNLSQLCVVTRITQCIHVIDPRTCTVAEISGAHYWRTPFNSLGQPRQLVAYMVMEVETVKEQDQPHIAGHASQSAKHMLADVWLCKESEMGTSDQQYHSRTHLGHLLTVGDSVLGLDLRTSNVNDRYLEKMKGDKIPDVILVKKQYADRTRRSRKRQWRLKHFDESDAAAKDKDNREYVDFLEDLEEDPDVRKNINIYKDPSKVAVDTDDTDDEEIPRISLAEMLDDLHLVGDATGEQGSAMME